MEAEINYPEKLSELGIEPNDSFEQLEKLDALAKLDKLNQFGKCSGPHFSLNNSTNKSPFKPKSECPTGMIY